MSAEGASDEPVNVLLVDDRPENLVALSAILANTGCNLLTATSGDKALGMLLRHEVAAILLDVMMPEKDGYEIASIIREREATRNIPIIFLTALATDVQHIYRGYEVGAVDYMLKPLDPQIVRSKVAVFVDLFQKERHIRKQGEMLRQLQHTEDEYRMGLQRQESEAWYSTTLRSIGDAVIATDAQGTIRFMNPIAEALTGWPLEEARGRTLENVFKIISEDTREEAENPAVRVVREGKIAGLANHTVLVSRNGAEFVIEDSAAPIRADPHNPMVGVVFVFRDTTHKRQEERRRTFLASSNTALLLSLDYGACLHEVASEAIRSVADSCIICVRRSDGSTEATIVANRDPKVEKRLNELTEHLPHDLTEPRVSTGQDVPEAFARFDVASCLSAPIVLRGAHLGTVTLLAGRTRPAYGPLDIEMASTLCERVATAIENSHLYEAAKRAIRQRDEFLSIASHELKTPITALKLQTQNVRTLIDRRRFAELPPERLDDLLNVGTRQVDRLARLVDQLLDVSKISVGRMHLETGPVDLQDIVRETLTQFAESLRRANCTVELSAGPAIGDWDRQRVEQVVVNMLTNAMKFGAGKPIEVRLEAAGPLACFSVRDHGIGIAREDQQRIFHRFERAVAYRDFPGLGMGLYISRQIVEAHGGTIRVESEPGQGALFVVELPITQSALTPITA